MTPADLTPDPHLATGAAEPDVTSEDEVYDDNAHSNAEYGEGELTDAERDLLTDEELAAILDSDEDEAGDEADSEAPAAVEAEAPAPEAPPAEAPKPVAPAPVGDAPTDEDIDAADAGLKAAKEQQSAILNRYDDGELTAAERDAELDALIPAIGKHAAVLDRAEKAFAAQKTSFADTATGYLTEYAFLATDGHIEAFDRLVREVTASPLSDGLTHRQMLETAHRRYEAEAALYGKALPQPAPKIGAAPAPKAEEPKPKGPPPLAPKPAAPRTLAHVPAAASNGPGGGPTGELEQEWEAIGDDTQRQERFLQRLTPEKREAFLRDDY